MLKPVALDLCKGLGGATKGLKAAGFFVVGVDTEDYSHIQDYVQPDAFIQADVRKFIPAEHLPALKVDFVWASPPCQEFSYSSFPFKKAREKFTKENPPDRSIWDACVNIAKELNAPLVLENVRGAQKWMGKAQAHYGSFYLWGDVPALLPIGRPVKGFVQAVKESCGKRGPLNAARVTEWRGNVQDFSPRGPGDRAFPEECERPEPTYKKMVGSEKCRGHEMSSTKDKYKMVGGSRNRPKHSARKEWSAKAAMIPEELALWIGQCFFPK